MKDEREQMVYTIKSKYGLGSSDVLSVMLQIPREKFVPKRYRDMVYHDGPVSIGYGQTMSQPYTVAYMTDLLELTGKEKVLEIGTGSGYQAAVLSRLAKGVYTVEIIRQLADGAKKTLKKLGFRNVYVRKGSGEYGWRKNAPYDAIIVTAGLGDKVPEELFDQLKKGGVLVAPLGRGHDKTMTRFEKNKNGEIIREKFGIFHFVPFVEEKD
ncbi:protein-L-isoaspartate O-methyltransferase [Candidatus Woesebacteria bacterium RIFCSPHIGHO2_01_FULL_39_32]|uniref:Protein-L-isoaspartate O-methyltransferase n=1 Tax=Candidatus Woesebacteria bacterium RIFCSPLOWO2_01_FULL_39_25 TaxID=1802521 RepID=A0A1F8BJA6_9BACT|nr:MAG: protein-L-isoaspartate O-methyltransferase [Candidatus Woesebacteria bacterium GWB1_37_5]OGM24453.1 MAG: protein-L-isoaspartate O-methyltransferase [Candidatus Woesebacteria bacterium RIFCSPHIGHO2_01_FULL_39_32]OGM35543.1 MAG: protein-L-isoaspartate O-methyltransferase [Candidatus Woesebacteria bacterium RIFCSPHIGHO2_12_FULL_38_11]OGM63759.1 MAG: protein-L-isoaspartate O-methyltransferase [Candidatus Woesebacteria bacterium RIFCSPLOWO2_01_FULL_39_25]